MSGQSDVVVISGENRNCLRASALMLQSFAFQNSGQLPKDFISGRAAVKLFGCRRQRLRDMRWRAKRDTPGWITLLAHGILLNLLLGGFQLQPAFILLQKMSGRPEKLGQRLTTFRDRDSNWWSNPITNLLEQKQFRREQEKPPHLGAEAAMQNC